MSRLSIRFYVFAVFMILVGLLGWSRSLSYLRHSAGSWWSDTLAMLPQIGCSSALLLAGGGIFWRKPWVPRLVVWQAVLALGYGVYAWIVTVKQLESGGWSALMRDVMAGKFYNEWVQI